MSITINVMGELAVFNDNVAVSLPASKRTRALLAFLALTNQSHRREWLCDVFWEETDDPRAALRWSLSKIRPLVNILKERLIADRQRVSFNISDVEIDIHKWIEQTKLKSLTYSDLKIVAAKLNEPLLVGIDLPRQELFQEWLNSERSKISKIRVSVLLRLVGTTELPFSERLSFANECEKNDPFNPEVATALLSILELMGHKIEVVRLSSEFTKRFRNAGITWLPTKRHNYTGSTLIQPNKINSELHLTEPNLLQRQRIQFCKATDGVRLAYATVGEGKPIVKAANWLSHLELDWDSPIWSPLYRELAKEYLFLRYDERGNGLSDWDAKDISYKSFVTDLETVIDANKLEKFALLGISQGAAVSIEYAVKHPNKVTHLILFGSYAAGWRHTANELMIKEREAVMTLTSIGWGQDNPVYRQIFTSTFMPDATPEELKWFNNFQRLTTSPENAVRFLDVFSRINVQDLLPKISVPTLVIHSLGDKRIPVDVGRDIAASIPNAEFVCLESNGHLLLGREPASAEFIKVVRDFLSRY
jgi:pimeloyl-ACP methyl ester carboxylesterase/DNA-binding SARP family transcriptional activator